MEDSLALKLMERLQNDGEIAGKFGFIELDSMDSLEEHGNKLLILDVVKGIEKVEIITDIDSIKRHEMLSMHDFDLGFNLKLLKKLGKISSVKIIGVPANYNIETALAEVKEKLAEV